MALLNTLTVEDYNELGEFLESDETPEKCMSLSKMDGFLTALVIGPEDIMPSQWLPILFGENSDEEIVWESPERAQRIFDLIMSRYNIISKKFQDEPKTFEPIVLEDETIEKDNIIIDQWCKGFMTIVYLCRESWNPLFTDKDGADAIGIFLLFGTEMGEDERRTNPEFQKIYNDQWERMLFHSLAEINEFWLPYRKAEHNSLKRSAQKQTQRNAPCPCGSGKKYKKCCWGKAQ